MKVILLRDIPRIGKKDEIKDIADGFAQNALLPKGLAKIATPQAIEALTAQKKLAEKQKTDQVEKYKSHIQKIKEANLVIEQPANTQGHLFSKFKIEQLSKVLKEKNIDIDIKHIIPFEFKEIGTHVIKVKFEDLIDTFQIEIKGLNS